ncbi:hypothetical protein [Campylobacter gracilis]|nr:hypothetical protein [Campylobacter gracilis]
MKILPVKRNAKHTLAALTPSRQILKFSFGAEFLRLGILKFMLLF